MSSDLDSPDLPTVGDDPPESEGKQFSYLGALAVVFAGRLTHVVIGVAVGVAIIRIWGASARGAIAVALVVPGMFATAFQVGVPNAITVLIGRAGDKRPEVAGTVLFLLPVCTLACMVAAIAIVPFHPVSNEPLIWIVLGLLMIPAKLSLFFMRGFALGVQRITFLAHIHWVRDPLTLTLLLIGAVIFGRDPAYAWVAIAANVFAHCVAALMGLRVFVQSVGWQFNPNVPAALGFLRRSLGYGVGSLFVRLNAQVPLLVLTTMPEHVSRSQIANFTVGQAVANMLWELPAALNQVLLSKGVEDDAPADFAEKTSRRVRRAMVVLVPAGMVIALLAPLLIPLVYGREITEAGSILQLMIPGVIVFFVGRGYEAVFNAQGKPLYVAAVMAPAAMMTVVVSWLLIRAGYGVYGAALAGTITYVTAGVVLSVVFARFTGLAWTSVVLPTRRDVVVVYSRIFTTIVNKLSRRRRGKGAA